MKMKAKTNLTKMNLLHGCFTGCSRLSLKTNSRFLDVVFDEPLFVPEPEQHREEEEAPRSHGGKTFPKRRPPPPPVEEEEVEEEDEDELREPKDDGSIRNKYLHLAWEIGVHLIPLESTESNVPELQRFLRHARTLYDELRRIAGADHFAIQSHQKVITKGRKLMFSRSFEKRCQGRSLQWEHNLNFVAYESHVETLYEGYGILNLYAQQIELRDCLGHPVNFIYRCPEKFIPKDGNYLKV
jgi:hypothetical protein